MCQAKTRVFPVKSGPAGREAGPGAPPCPAFSVRFRGKDEEAARIRSAGVQEPIREESPGSRRLPCALTWKSPSPTILPIMPKRIRSLRRMLSVGIRLSALIAAIAPLACSQGDNSVLNPGTNRTGLTALPDTIRIGEPSADRSARATVAAGGLADLLLARFPDSLETVVYLRFTDLPDTAGLTGARLGLRVRGGAGTALQIEAYPVDPSAPAWTEGGIRWNNRPALASEPLDVVTGPIDAPGDTTILYRDAVRIPADLIRSWKRDPDTNRGIALLLRNGSAGSLSIRSREAILDSVNIANPPLEFLEGSAVVSIKSPTADAFVYHDLRPVADGADTLLRITEEVPNRILLRFPLAEAVPRGSIINRAVLRLRLLEGMTPDSMRLGAYGFIHSNPGSVWSEAAEPDSAFLGVFFSSVLLPAELEESTASFEIARLAQQWFNGTDTLGVQIRGLSELIGEGEAAFYSSESAAPAYRPSLEIVFTPPPGPRWGSSEEGGVR